jgi:hypothetical protein
MNPKMCAATNFKKYSTSVQVDIFAKCKTRKDKFISPSPNNHCSWASEIWFETSS